MGVESRRSGQYYYRKRRIGHRVVSEYIGTGEVAALCARLDTHARQEAQEKRQAWQATVDADQALDTMLDAVTEAVAAYAEMLLLVSGHHQHRGQWRKQREQRQI